MLIDVLKTHFNGVSSVEIIDTELATSLYGKTTFSEPVTVHAALQVKEKSIIPTIIKLANSQSWQLYPVSSCKNWGYGSVNNVDECGSRIVLDLSPMNRIYPVSKELGILTVEPGVTQQILADYLEKQDWQFMTPVTGAGPNCSILSNALERGYGITPYTDHFSAVTSLKAYLPNPDLCESEYISATSSLDTSGVDFVDKTFKWGVGPYIEGLFTQSNFGIVTEATIRLAPKPKGFCAFYIQCFDESKFGQLVLLIREVMRSLEGIVGSINLMDKRRLIAMVADNPQGPGVHAVMNAQQVISLGNKNHLPEWMVVGSIYGEPEIVRSAKKIVSRLCKGLGKLIFSDGIAIKAGTFLSNLVPVGPLKNVRSQLQSLQEGIDIMQGKPNQVALPLAYWRNPYKKADKSKALLPDQDACGLLWYAPLIPMEPEAMANFVEFVRKTTPKYGIEPLITFTNLRYDCVDSTVPIVFNLKDPDALQAAHACLDELVEIGLRKGYVPYRLNVEQQRKLLAGQISEELSGKLKMAFDPNNVLAPGRYSSRY
ncbi:FAD-binding oxidoreductase [Bowmanella denitrificans]|uniref:FAD-binding oxidoreductase n=1 Tax=Bowmanella denitrificans TaxID=366582 RepID=UPI000C9BA0D9|nr:FAD-binding protein [Bowmanella denitrificans]